VHKINDLLLVLQAENRNKKSIFCCPLLQLLTDRLNLNFRLSIGFALAQFIFCGWT